MAKSFEGIFGGIFDQGVYLRDSRHAANAYGFNKADLSNGTPRHRFEFFIRINFNPHPEVRDFVKSFLSESDNDMVSTMVKTITMPSMNIDTEILNQYNKKRISQTKIDYNPISITFHDSVEGRTLRFWEMYYEYYFRDGVAPEKLGTGSAPPEVGGGFFDGFLESFSGVGAPTPKRDAKEYDNDLIKDRFNDNYGYNLSRVGNHKYLIDSIDIFQIHGGKFSKTEIIRPRVTGFSHDTLDYEDTSGLVELKFDFVYEGVVYANVNQRLNRAELERFRFGDFNELANLITIRSPIRGRNIDIVPVLPNVACGPGTVIDQVGSANPLLASPLGSTVFSVIGQRNLSLVQDSIGDIVGSIPDAIGTTVAASIFGGTVSFNPDPIAALKTTANTILRGTINRTRDNFAAGITGGVTNVVTGIIDPGDE